MGGTLRDVLPDVVVDHLKDYLRGRAREVQADVWASAHLEEDTITGDFFGSVRKRETIRTLGEDQAGERGPLERVGELPNSESRLTRRFLGEMGTSGGDLGVGGRGYHWFVTYTKLRGRGYGAEEKFTGSDGIFEVEVEDLDTREIHRKGMPFQAKKNWRTRDGTLLEQVRKMERIAQGASCVIDYSEEGFTAVRGSAVIESDGRRPQVMSSAGDLLAEAVECTVGRRGLTFDAARGIFVVGGAAKRMAIGHRLRLTVEVS